MTDMRAMRMRGTQGRTGEFRQTSTSLPRLTEVVRMTLRHERWHSLGDTTTASDAMVIFNLSKKGYPCTNCAHYFGIESGSLAAFIPLDASFSSLPFV